MKFESRGPSKQEFPKMFAAAQQSSGTARQAAAGSLEN